MFGRMMEEVTRKGEISGVLTRVKHRSVCGTQTCAWSRYNTSTKASRQQT